LVEKINAERRDQITDAPAKTRFKKRFQLTMICSTIRS
jgi:hypothetical protein